jgi:hypothetical protein
VGRRCGRGGRHPPKRPGTADAVDRLHPRDVVAQAIYECRGAHLGPRPTHGSICGRRGACGGLRAAYRKPDHAGRPAAPRDLRLRMHGLGGWASSARRRWRWPGSMA